MTRILRLYVIREIALPTMLALLTVTFILIIGILYQLIGLLMQPNVGVWQVLEVLFETLPSMIVFAAPMALLIGSLIGIGRMMMDREVLAIRANGINLFSVFIPALVLSFGLSLGVMGLAGTSIPKVLLRAMTRVSELKYAAVSSLEPGQIHDSNRLGGKNVDFSLYFRERDRAGAMKFITIKQDAFYMPNANKKKLWDAGESKTTPTLAAQARPVAKKSDHEASVTQGRDTRLTMIYAESGVILTRVKSGSLNRAQQGTIVLSLANGTIHRLNPDDKDYVVLHFKKMEYMLLEDRAITKRNQTMTNQELNAVIRQNRAELAKPAKPGATDQRIRDNMEDDIGAARSVLTERHSLSLASFIFVLVGIPLAIWVRPSGKSWGILLAIALMLMYYVLMRFGLAMVAANKPLGVPVTYLPNLLFLAVGGGLWWQSLRS